MMRTGCVDINCTLPVSEISVNQKARADGSSAVRPWARPAVAVGRAARVLGHRGNTRGFRLSRA